MTLEELLPRAEWLLDFAISHPVEMELYNFAYGPQDTQHLYKIVETRRLDPGEIDAVLARFEKRLPLVSSARWN